MVFLFGRKRPAVCIYSAAVSAEHPLNGIFPYPFANGNVPHQPVVIGSGGRIRVLHQQDKTPAIEGRIPYFQWRADVFPFLGITGRYVAFPGERRTTDAESHLMIA